VYIEQLGYSNQVWSALGSGWLGTNGVVSLTFSNAFSAGWNGVYRAYTTNAWATNGFGVMKMSLGPGHSMVGSLFASEWVSDLLPNAPDGTIAYLYDPVTDSYLTSERVGADWVGDQEVPWLAGVLVYNPSTNSATALVSGVITTNAVTLSLPAGSAMIASPLFRVYSTNALSEADLMISGSTNQLGGLSVVPVASVGWTSQSQIDRLPGGSTNLSYRTWSLNQTNAWIHGGAISSVPIRLGEGFWLTKPTNATWSVPARMLTY